MHYENRRVKLRPPLSFQSRKSCRHGSAIRDGIFIIFTVAVYHYTYCICWFFSLAEPFALTFSLQDNTSYADVLLCLIGTFLAIIKNVWSIKSVTKCLNILTRGLSRSSQIHCEKWQIDCILKGIKFRKYMIRVQKVHS